MIYARMAKEQLFHPENVMRFFMYLILVLVFKPVPFGTRLSAEVPADLQISPSAITMSMTTAKNGVAFNVYSNGIRLEGARWNIDSEILKVKNGPKGSGSIFTVNSPGFGPINGILIADHPTFPDAEAGALIMIRDHGECFHASPSSVWLRKGDSITIEAFANHKRCKSVDWTSHQPWLTLKQISPGVIQASCGTEAPDRAVASIELKGTGDQAGASFTVRIGISDPPGTVRLLTPPKQTSIIGSSCVILAECHGFPARRFIFFDKDGNEAGAFWDPDDSGSQLAHPSGLFFKPGKREYWVGSARGLFARSIITVFDKAPANTMLIGHPDPISMSQSPGKGDKTPPREGQTFVHFLGTLAQKSSLAEIHCLSHPNIAIRIERIESTGVFITVTDHSPITTDDNFKLLTFRLRIDNQEGDGRMLLSYPRK